MQHEKELVSPSLSTILSSFKVEQLDLYVSFVQEISYQYNVALAVDAAGHLKYALHRKACAAYHMLLQSRKNSSTSPYSCGAAL